MSGKTIGADKEEEIRRVYATCRSKSQTARVCGVDRSTVAKVVGRCSSLSHGPTPEDVEAMRRAADAGMPDDDENETPEVIWRREEERSRRCLRRMAKMSVLRWVSPGPHLLLVFIADQHMAPGAAVDFRRMREDAELIRDTPHCYCILGGDGIDNHIKHRAAMIGSSGTPELQYQLYEHYLRILGDRCLLMTSGNHEMWTKQFAGVDILRRIALDNRIVYAPHEGRMELVVGSQTYKVAVRHQYRYNSSLNPTHTLKQWIRMGRDEWDIGCIGHHHEHAIESFLYRGRLRWGCRPGSYQITSDYSSQHGFADAVPTTPTFLLRGDEWGISGWPTLQHAVDSFRCAKELGVA